MNSARGNERGVLRSCARKVRCPQGCQELILVEYLQNHVRYACSHRHGVCELCGKSVVLQFKKNHAKECPRLLINCPNDDCTDGSKVAQEKLEEHLKVCTTKVKPCKYAYIGCEFKGSGMDLNKHENNIYKHFKHVADLLSVFNLQFDVLTQNTKGEILLLQNENFAFRERLKAVLIQFERLRDVNDNLTRKVDNLQVCVRRLLAKHGNGGESNVMEDDDMGRDVLMDMSAVKSSSVWKKDLGRYVIENRKQMDLLEQLKAKVDSQEAIITNLSASLHNEGVFLWKITEYARLKADSSSGRRMFISSDNFFTDRYGYKLYGKVFVGGDGEGHGSHLSLFVCISCGPWDNVLPWPFRRRITFRLLDQRDVDVATKEDVKETFVPNPNLISFQKPLKNANIGSGIAKFVSHAVVEDSGKYLIDDAIYVEISVAAAGDECNRRRKPF